jgi:hypothetical protein
MEVIKEYEITVAGSVPGYPDTIPANHRLVVNKTSIFHDGSNWILSMQVATFKDNNHYAPSIRNINFPNNTVLVTLGVSLPTTGTKTLVKNHMANLLDNFANVGPGNYIEDPA